jgi:zinc ribbon protein
MPGVEMLHRKAQRGLRQALRPDEPVRLVIPGLAAGAIVATERRAFVFKVGARAGLPFSARLKEFEYESVMRIDLRPAGDVDVVVIHAPLKISSCSSYWADPRDDPWKARNAIPVTRRSTRAASLVDELSQLVALVNDRAVSRDKQTAQDRKRAAQATPDVVGHIADLETAARPTSEPTCPTCGSELGTGWQFCPRCGTPAKLARRDRAAPQRRRRQPGRST